MPDTPPLPPTAPRGCVTVHLNVDYHEVSLRGVVYRWLQKRSNQAGAVGARRRAASHRLRCGTGPVSVAWFAALPQLPADQMSEIKIGDAVRHVDESAAVRGIVEKIEEYSTGRKVGELNERETRRTVLIRNVGWFDHADVVKEDRMYRIQAVENGLVTELATETDPEIAEKVAGDFAEEAPAGVQVRLVSPDGKRVKLVSDESEQGGPVD